MVVHIFIVNYLQYLQHSVHTNWANMVAGGFAGLFESCVFYPLDTVKTRIQDMSEKDTAMRKMSPLGVLWLMVRKEGPASVYKGLGVTLLGAGPSHAAYFGSYEVTKNYLATNYSDNIVNYGIAGVVATGAHDAILNPTEMVKQRLQRKNSPYKSVIECVTTVYRKEGFRAFYRSFGLQFLINIPFQCTHFITYEVVCKLLNPEGVHMTYVHVTAGAVAGGVAASVTMPFDVCKTLLNIQPYDKPVVGLHNAFMKIYRLAGLPGLFRGLSARVLFFVPSTAICWTTYESLRDALS